MSMYEQHLLLRLLFCFCCRFCWRADDALSCGGACSGRSRCCFCNSMCCLSCSCAFKLQLVPVPAFGLVRFMEHEQHLLFRLAAVSAAVSVEGLLMQFHVEVLALPFVDAASAILCAACLAPAHLSCSWCRFLLWVSLRALWYEHV